MAELPKFVTLSVETPLCPYGIAYRRSFGLPKSGLLKKSRWHPLCGKDIKTHDVKKHQDIKKNAERGETVACSWSSAMAACPIGVRVQGLG